MIRVVFMCVCILLLSCSVYSQPEYYQYNSNPSSMTPSQYNNYPIQQQQQQQMGIPGSLSSQPIGSTISDPSLLTPQPVQVTPSSQSTAPMFENQRGYPIINNQQQQPQPQSGMVSPGFSSYVPVSPTQTNGFNYNQNSMIPSTTSIVNPTIPTSQIISNVNPIQQQVQPQMNGNFQIPQNQVTQQQQQQQQQQQPAVSIPILSSPSQSGGSLVSSSSSQDSFPIPPFTNSSMTMNNMTSSSTPFTLGDLTLNGPFNTSSFPSIEQVLSGQVQPQQPSTNCDSKDAVCQLYGSCYPCYSNTSLTQCYSCLSLQQCSTLKCQLSNSLSLCNVLPQSQTQPPICSQIIENQSTINGM